MGWIRTSAATVVAIVVTAASATAYTAYTVFAALPAAAAAPEDPPGTVVAVGPLDSQHRLPGAARNLLVTYWSEGPHDLPMLSTGAVYVPPGTPPAGGWPVVSWAHGTTGLADGCAPTVEKPVPNAVAYLTHWLGQGYAVVATDYVGLGTPGLLPYLDGRSAAHSVIDMVRAARSVDRDLAARWIVVGQSEGGQAAMFTARLATGYAPELDYRGAVATGVPSNIETLLPLGGPQFPPLPLVGTGVFMAYLLADMQAYYPDLDVGSYLSPFGQTVVNEVQGLCYPQAAARFGHVSIGQLLSRSVDTPGLRALAARLLAIPTSGYDRPIFLGQGLIDTMVPAVLTAKLVADLAANRVDFTLHAYPTGHVQTVAAALPDTTPFVARLLPVSPR
ncbi:lipase family protein [Speluncibacter jeojiensis]|uniref:Lipase family protein n=1 Tax=Speluncibacter jeojiensis TaxID=2710754 RepID=A0A9X4LYL9_9ACTN|nr:lipase family protein [Corynebacteriales bacterium D3-21]